jgi:hypothetical protein
MRDVATLDVRIARNYFRCATCHAVSTAWQFSQAARAANPDVDTFFGDTPCCEGLCVTGIHQFFLSQHDNLAQDHDNNITTMAHVQKWCSQTN